MYSPRFELAGFDVLDSKDKCPLILALVRGLISINLKEIQVCRAEKNPIPPMYDEWREGNIVYFPQGKQDDWKDCTRVLLSGGGSCNSLSAWRVAELTDAGVSCGPWIQTQIQRRKKGGLLHVFHVIVWIGDHPRSGGHTTWECPSRTLGMKSTPYED